MDKKLRFALCGLAALGVCLAAPAQGFKEAEPPAGLQAAAAAQAIYVHWDPSSDYTVTGYNVYRDTAADGPFDLKLNEEPTDCVCFTDDTVTPGAEYFYRATAVTGDGIEGAEFSNLDSATAGEIVVTMPDIQGPAGSEVRLPVNLDAAWGIAGSGTEIHVQYDPAVLTPVRVEKTALTEGFVMVDNIEAASGEVAVIFVGGDTLVGDGHVIDVYFEVAAEAAGGATATQLFTSVEMLDWELTPLAVDFSDTSLFTVDAAFVLGDVTGDGVVDLADVTLAQKWVTEKPALNSMQLSAGDVNGDSDMTTADVTGIGRLALGLPINPPEGSKAPSARLKAAASYALAAGTEAGYQGQTVAMDVTIDTTDAVAGCDFSLVFDSASLSVSDVTLGAAADGCSLDWHVDGGMLRASLSGTEDLDGTGGTLATVAFEVIGLQQDTYDSAVNLAAAELGGIYGEDLSWYADVSLSSGAVTIEGDADLDGIPNTPDGIGVDTDGDGTENWQDTDSDGDTLADSDEFAFGQDAWNDYDGDGTLNFLDTDSDNDGFTDAEEAAVGSDPYDENDVPGLPAVGPLVLGAFALLTAIRAIRRR